MADYLSNLHFDNQDAVLSQDSDVSEWLARGDFSLAPIIIPFFGVRFRIGDDDDNTIHGSFGTDVIFGKGGNDLLFGDYGHDFIFGGAGNDEIHGNQGNDFLVGGSGEDLIYGGLGSDIIYGGLDADTILGGPGFDLIFGEEGDDTIDGGRGFDIIKGGDGNDVLAGGLGIDHVDGGDGDDIFHVFAAPDLFDILMGGDGYDEIVNIAPNAAVRIASFGPANSIEQISTTNGIPMIVSSDFDDVLDFTGVTFVGINRIQTRKGDDTVTGTAGDDIINGLEGDDTLYGADGNDILIGSYGNDMLFGGNGNDTLRGQEGIDSVHGGAGDDVLNVYGYYDQFDTFDGGTGVDTIRNGLVSGSMVFDSFDPSNNVERVNGLGQDGNAHGIKGNSGDNVLDFSGVAFFNVTKVDGRDGNDTIIGTSGGDKLLGGGDDDIITGGLGDDEISGNSGSDTAVWSGDFADYDISFAAGVYTVDDMRGGAVDEGVDTVTQVETFTFADGSWSADNAGNLVPLPVPVLVDDMSVF